MAKTKNVEALAAAAGALVAVGLLVLMVVLQPRPAGATFPGPNGKIAYTVLNDSGIYTINPGGGGKTKVAVGDTPSYSPNGKRIAYSSSDGHDYEIYTKSVGGGGKAQVTNNDTDDFWPSYSPDGKKIAYQGYEENDPEIYTDTEIFTVNASGGAAFNVTNNDTFDFQPSYSPDGKKIAYVGFDGTDPDEEIYTINVGGGALST